MDPERTPDAVDAWLEQTPRWDPPEGFVLRVIAAARSDARRKALLREAPPSRGVLARLRSLGASLAARGEGALWTARQYARLLGRR